MHRKTISAAASVVAFWLAAFQPVHALENPAKGKALAKQWCSSCHLVTPDQTSAKADVPPFMTIAKLPDEELERLSVFLIDPHPKMPNFNLSRQQITDMIGYIRTLR